MQKEEFFEKIIHEESLISKDLIKEDILKVASSLIHKEGVFALKEIHSDKYFYSVPMDDLRNTPTPNCAKISNNTFINDPKILNYVNHSCDPNSELVLDQKGAFLRSKRKILVGEEITLDYCATEEKNNLVECKCKSTNCRNFFYYS
jgi:hypothetical protein